MEKEWKRKKMGFGGVPGANGSMTNMHSKWHWKSSCTKDEWVWDKKIEKGHITCFHCNCEIDECENLESQKVRGPDLRFRYYCCVCYLCYVIGRYDRSDLCISCLDAVDDADDEYPEVLEVDLSNVTYQIDYSEEES